MKKNLLLLSAVAVAASASAQSAIGGSGAISITSGTGLIYSQNFDTLEDTTTTTTGGTTLPTGWYIFEIGTNTNSVNGKYRANNGASNSGDAYSFGTNSSTTDRSLGSLASGSNTPYFGAKFTNNTGSTITGFGATLKMEQWRVGDTANLPDTTLFMYSTAATGIDDTSAAAAWTMNNSLMLNSVVNVSTSTSGNAVDGETTSRNMTATLALSVPNGGSFYIRWKDKNIGGADDGLSIDNLNMIFTTGPSAVSNVAENNLPLSLLGNGTTNDVKAAFTAPENGTYTVTVTDLAGRVVSTQNGATTKGEVVSLPVSNQALAAGMYLVRVAQGTFSGVEKLSIR